MNPIVLHTFGLSGHAHRAQLFLSLLGLPVRLVDVDLRTGAHKQPDYLRKHPFGQVPVIEDGDVTLWDSNAILVYLATRYDTTGTWYPRDAVAAARVQQWLSAAAGPLAFGPALARAIKLFGFPLDLERAVTIAGQLMPVLDQALEGQAFLAGDKPTIADVAMYSYTARAPEGGISLEPFGNVRAWLARVEALPGFVPMPSTPPRG